MFTGDIEDNDLLHGSMMNQVDGLLLGEFIGQRNIK